MILRLTNQHADQSMSTSNWLNTKTWIWRWLLRKLSKRQWSTTAVHSPGRSVFTKIEMIVVWWLKVLLVSLLTVITITHLDALHRHAITRSCLNKRGDKKCFHWLIKIWETLLLNAQFKGIFQFLEKYRRVLETEGNNTF